MVAAQERRGPCLSLNSCALYWGMGEIMNEREGLTTPGEWGSLASQLLLRVMCLYPLPYVIGMSYSYILPP